MSHTHNSRRTAPRVEEPRQWQWQVRTPRIAAAAAAAAATAICNTHQISDPCVYHYSLSSCSCEHKSVVQTTLCSRGCDRWYTGSMCSGKHYGVGGHTLIYRRECRESRLENAHKAPG